VDTKDMDHVLQALGAVLEAASLSTADQKKLVAFVQARQSAEADAEADDEDSEDSDFARPAHGVKKRSGGIAEVMEDMKAKADTELSDLRKEETSAKHEYEMLRQSLESQLTVDRKTLEEEKAARANEQEKKASDESDLEVTNKELAHSKKQVATAKATCMQTARDHEATLNARTEELTVIAKATQILRSTVSGVPSFLQVASRSRVPASDVVTMVKHLAKQQHSAALAQLSSRMAAIARLGASSGSDPFKKIRGMLRDMMDKLRAQGREEAETKVYCDEQMGKTKLKKEDLEEDVSKQTASFDTATSKSAELKEDIKELDTELAALAKEQAELDRIRAEEKEDYENAKPDLESSLMGIRKALSILRDYYGSASLLQDNSNFEALMQQPAMPQKHTSSTSPGTGIIQILEVCESDMAKNIQKLESQEADARMDYDKVTQENRLSKSAKEADVKFKSQQVKSLANQIAELSTDNDNAKSELTAVNEYFAKVKDRCVAEAPSYQERQKRRDAELRGLKEALQVLEEEASFVQRKRSLSVRQRLRASSLISSSADE